MLWSLTMCYEIEIIDLKKIVSSEDTEPNVVYLLTEKICTDNFWYSVIPIEASKNIVMDGNHRIMVAYRLGLKRVPIVRLNYSDESVKVLDWSTNKEFDIHSIFETINKGVIFPYKTTRHIFTPQLPHVKIPLLDLM